METFYKADIENGDSTLPEDEARHCIRVLRKKAGDAIILVDGKGGKFLAVIAAINKRNVTYQLDEKLEVIPKPFKTHLAIAPTKSMDRMEWLVEKCAEIGVDALTLLETQHSERRKIRLDRLEKKAISAMKQSGNVFLMDIQETISLNDFLDRNLSGQQFIAHVDPQHPHLANVIKPKEDVTLVVGPEGDFSSSEMSSAIEAGFQPVSLGQPTLRTETAGFVACCVANTINFF